ncbi:AP-3 complex subunit beta, partial [Perkinsus olseni]
MAISIMHVLCMAIGLLGWATTGATSAGDPSLVEDQRINNPPIVETQFNVTDLSILTASDGVLASVSDLFADNGTLSLCAAKAISVISSASAKVKATVFVVGEAMSGAGERIRPVMAEASSRAGELWMKAGPMVQYAIAAVEVGCEVMVKEAYPVGRDMAVGLGSWVAQGVQYVAEPARQVVWTGMTEVGRALVRAASAIAFSGQYWWYSAILPSVLNARSLTDDLVLTATMLFEKFSPPVMEVMAEVGGRAGDAASRVLLAAAPCVLDTITFVGATVMDMYTTMPSASSGLDLLVQKAVEAGQWVQSQLPLACSARTLNSLMTSPLDPQWARVLASSNNCTKAGTAIRQWRAAWHPDARLNGRGNNDSRLANCTVAEIEAGFQSASSTADDIKAVACGEARTEVTGIGGIETKAVLRQIAVAVGAPLLQHVSSGASFSESKYFNGSINLTQGEIRRGLNSPAVEAKLDAMRRLLAAEASSDDPNVCVDLFSEVVKIMSTTNLELKRLVYIWIVSHAEARRELALLSVNSFQKDSVDSRSALVGGGSAVGNWMGLGGVSQVVMAAVNQAAVDSSAYVRKSVVAVCLPQVFVTDIDQFALVRNLLVKMMATDGSELVVGAAAMSYFVVCIQLYGLVQDDEEHEGSSAGTSKQEIIQDSLGMLHGVYPRLIKLLPLMDPFG